MSQKAVTPTRSGAEFAKMLMQVALRYPRARTIHLVVDNLSTHSRACVVRHNGEPRGGELLSRFTVHYTPKHGSWRNQAEIEIGLLNRQCIGKRRFPSLDELHAEVRQWNRRVNRMRLGFRWRFTTKKARSTFQYKPLTFRRSQD